MARKLLKGMVTPKPKRLSNNCAHLRSVAREIMMCCSGEMASTRRDLASSIARAKTSFCRVDRDVKNTQARQGKRAEAVEALKPLRLVLMPLGGFEPMRLDAARGSR
jgi:hypothetical protein